MATPLKGTPAYEQRFTPRVGRPNEEAETFEETPLTFRRVFGFDAPPTSRVGAGAVRKKPEGEGEYGRYFRQLFGEIFQPKGVKPTQRVPTRKQEEKAPTPAPEQVKPEPAKTPEPEAKPEVPRRIFRAMVQGDPAKDQIFETKKEAEDYLKNQGLKGVVAGIRFKGETPEDIAQKEKAYRGALVEEKGRKGALESLYATRKEQATERVGRIREAAADYDAATTPAQKEAARGRAEAARLEGMLEEATRRMPQEQKQKVATGLAGVLQRRGEREARVQRETAQAQAESRAQRAGIAQERAIDNQLKFYNQQLGTLRRAYRNARIAGDDRAMFDIGQLIDVWKSGVPDDPREQRKAARGGILQEKFTQLEKERRRREELAKTNPDAAR